MISVVVALPAEARPIVRRFELERDGSAGTRFYRGRDLRLVVSGVGSAASAAAVERLADGPGRQPRAWVNFGIAGHRELAIATPRLAHKIVDVASGRSWYPPAVFEPPCAGAEVRTVDDVETSFANDALYEMEAAGFYRAASRHATAELIQVLKVVSDNRDTPSDRLSAARVEELVEGVLPTLEGLIRKLDQVARELETRLAPPPGLDRFLERWHFTVTQERQLARLLERLRTLDRPVDVSALGSRRSARDVLSALEERL